MVSNPVHNEHLYQSTDSKSSLFIDVELGQTSTLENKIMSNDGLFKYITNVYLFSGMGWIFTLVFAELMSLTITQSNYNVLVWIYIILGFVFTIFTSIISLKPSEIVVETNGDKREIISNFQVCYYFLFCFSLGMMISPSVYIVNNSNPIIFLVSIGITTGIFILVQIITLIQKDLEGLKYYVPLMSCVGGLIMISIVELILALAGFDKIVRLISFGINIISVIVFTGLIYVDTLKAINSYNKSELNAIKCAIELVLDLVTILLNIMDLLLKLISSDD